MEQNEVNVHLTLTTEKKKWWPFSLPVVYSTSKIIITC